MKINKLKEYIMVLVIISLVVFLIKYLNIVNIIKEIIIILLPVIIGFIYAWLFNPLIRLLSKKYNRKLICISIFLLVILIICLFFYFLIPLVMKELSELMDIFPNYLNKLKNTADKVGCLKYLENIIYFISDIVPKLVLKTAKNFFKYIGNGIVGLVLGLYISFDYEKIIVNLFKVLKKKRIDRLLIRISDAVRNCIYGTLLIAFFVFVLDSIMFSIIGLDGSILLGLVCGITDLIPYIGPYIGGFLAVIVGFTEKDVLGYIAIGICFVVQLIENYILQPVVMSKTIKISPILIICGLLIFGRLFGVIGMIIATPCMTIIKVLSEDYLNLFDKKQVNE